MTSSLAMSSASTTWDDARLSEKVRRLLLGYPYDPGDSEEESDVCSDSDDDARLSEKERRLLLGYPYDPGDSDDSEDDSDCSDSESEEFSEDCEEFSAHEQEFAGGCWIESQVASKSSDL